MKLFYNLDEGLNWLSKEWKLCRALKNSSDVRSLKNWLTDSYGYMAMLNYPYPTNFLNPLPGNPVREFCKYQSNSSATGKDLLLQINKGINIYFNYTGKEKCLSFDGDPFSRLGLDAWDYQVSVGFRN